ncbi:Activating signal cointegrator 1 complex subunit 1 [Schistosoma japonicum]|nr:Activating signal cointegrator 1 complex subunit 1 [Schistosoma japonicum]KAH8862994.1 Activating signal cointegrator 1 complex subunit 1 [Schistosoma japonicum]
MDSVLTPEMIHIGPRHYRKNASRQCFIQSFPPSISQIEEIPDAEEADINETDPEILELNKKIMAVDNGYTISIEIPPLFHKFIIGVQHSKRKLLEDEFRCNIDVPNYGSNSTTVSVTGPSRFNILNACRRILWIVADARTRCQPTHFICLPVTCPSVKDNFQTFRQSILQAANECTSHDFMGVDSSIFHSVSTLHFTLTTLVLADESEVEKAREILLTFRKSQRGLHLFAAGPLNLTIKDLEYMNDDPTSVHVLYAKLMESPDSRRLQTIANELSNLLAEQNLTSTGSYRPDNNVKLHMTLLNSKYRQERSSRNALSQGSLPNTRTSFSITGILKIAGNFSFAENQSFNEIYLCDRLSLDSTTQFYKFCCKLEFGP